MPLLLLSASPSRLSQSAAAAAIASSPTQMSNASPSICCTKPVVDRAVIIGGGLGGLAAALQLRKIGIDAQNPRFMAFLQSPPPSQSIGNKKQKSEPAKAQPQVIHTAVSMETPVHLPETMQSPNPVHNAQEQVAETPVLQAAPIQPATFQQPIIGSNGQGSDLQAMQQVFPPPSIHPGNSIWGAQTMMPNPMYGGIGLQPGFQSTHGQFGMPQASFGMAGIANQQPYMTSPGQFNSGQGRQINPNSVPMFQSLPYDNLTPLEKPTPYKEGGKGVTFTTFTGFDDRKKALSFLQQFDKAYAGGNFTEASKVRKAATYLTGNAGQWWTTLLLQGQAPSTWIYFKQIFASAWLSDDFEADVMTEWHQLSAASCKNLDDYNRKFCKALLPVTSYRFVPLTEQIEKYCCGLPKGLRKYCTKTKVTTLTQLIEVANTGNGLLKGEDCESTLASKMDLLRKIQRRSTFSMRFLERHRSRLKHGKGLKTGSYASLFNGRTVFIINGVQGKLYWAFSVEDDYVEGSTKIRSKSPEEMKQRLLSYYEGFSLAISIIQVTEPELILERRVLDLPVLSTWFQGNTVLLGDAVHAVTPSLGQGANLAFEDGMQLAKLLVSSADLRSALEEYQAMQMPRARQISKQSQTRDGKTEDAFYDWLYSPKML
ncbi:hypothetical protein L7F22_001825 [Adiantum nelumboides]|nr:hypothetical protein [Adiantum nelumboides]